MNQLEDLKNIATQLLNQGKHKDAIVIYNELYNQLWVMLANINSASFSNISKRYVMDNSNFYKKLLESSLNAFCIKNYQLSVDNILKEFEDVLFGTLKCNIILKNIKKGIISDISLIQFAILYKLKNSNTIINKLNGIFSFLEIILDNKNNVKLIKPKFTVFMLDKYFAEIFDNNYFSKYSELNNMLYEYISLAHYEKLNIFSILSLKINKNKANHSYSSNYNYYKNSYKEQSGNDYYKAKEYKDIFYLSENEKKRYFGKILNLNGVISKSQIRTNYLQMISMYHPDKVQKLGPEIREIAEKKSKEINMAYEWMKSKYGII